MNIPLVNLVRQYKKIEHEIKKATEAVYERGDFVLGQDVTLFEKEFAVYCGTKYAIGVASGFDAILLLLRALNIGKGDEVITVANTFISTILPILYVGAIPVFVDIDPISKSMDVKKMKNAISNKTKAILPVHLYGYPVDIDAIKETIKGRNIFLIEDAAQAQGSSYKGKKCGNLADAAAFSFYPGKNLGAYGEAGAVVTNNEDLAEKINVLRNVGQNKKYYHSTLGYNSRLDTLQAAILRVKLRYLDEWNERRREHAKLYNSLLLESVIIPQEEINYKTNYHVYCIETKKRDAFAKRLAEKGIATGIHYPVPIHMQAAMKDVRFKKHDLRITEEKAKNILSLPMFPELQKKEIIYISDSIKAFVNS